MQIAMMCRSNARNFAWILELCDHGRIRVDLEQQFTKHKTDVFSLDDVNKFFQRRPRAESIMGAGEHNA
eukprot:SAG11_NODE_8917_length_962_cov_1.205098_1_plen_68_part_01